MNHVIKRCSLFLLIILLLLSLVACASRRIEDIPEIRTTTEEILNALLAEDPEAAYNAVYNGIDQTEFNKAFEQMRNAISGTESYSLTPIQYNYFKRNGVLTTQLGYRMVTQTGVFVVTAAITEGYDGLISFYITPEERTSLIYTGTLGSMQGADALQWTVFVIGVLSWIFVIWMVVDCCRKKLKWKPLWLLLIILGGVLITVSLKSGSANFNVNTGLHLRLSALIYYGDGSQQLSLLIPVGAIIYRAVPKKLIKPTEPEEVSEGIPEETPAETNDLPQASSVPTIDTESPDCQVNDKSET